jgi:hypothetical protein
MSSKRKFTGVPFTPKSKCIGCEHLEQCKNSDNSLTIKLMVLECERFYYIFKQLEAFEKFPVLGESVEKNQEIVNNFKKQHEGIPSLTSPLVVNGALAAELALKFLIFKEVESYECIHNLQLLFEQLPDCHKNALTEIICEQAHQNDETLKFNLANISNLFEDFRYSFGKEHLGYTNFFNEFVHIVCDYAILQKPIDEEGLED